MVEEAYVSFETAKLLKEKGFDTPVWTRYENDDNDVIFGDKYNWNNSPMGQTSAPTIQMAMRWLREVYHIEIYITFGFPFIDGKQQYKYFWSIVKVCDNHLEYPMNDPSRASYNEEMVDSYEEAVEAAIKYCLENLIYDS